MSHIKIITPESLTFDEPVVQLVKLSRRGILGSDMREFEKRASADVLMNLPDVLEKLASGDVLVHILAMGATEDYGSNRNGDGFRRKTCRECHPTFVKYAHFFRNHQNKDPKKAYGRIIKSAFHEPMKRIELLAALNGTEEAARRNGGLFADREMEKLARGKDIPVSMACKVAYDVCSYCGNKAPRTEDYCVGTHQGGMCKAGGLRDNIGSLVEIDGGVHQLHADNPYPKFFDMSHVPRGADRIAYVTGMLEKQAAYRGGIVKSADLARELGVDIPVEMMIDSTQPAAVQQMIKLAYQLSEIESQIESGNPPLSADNLKAFSPVAQCLDREMDLPPMFREKFALALRALSDSRISLPLPRFVEIVAGHEMEKAAEVAALVAPQLPGIYTRLVSDSDFPDRVKDNRYGPAQAAAPPRFARWASKHAADLSLATRYVYDRVTRAALHRAEPSFMVTMGREKLSSDRGPTERLAEEYALYKLAFVGSVPESDPDFQLTASLAILQNYAD